MGVIVSRTSLTTVSVLSDERVASDVPAGVVTVSLGGAYLVHLVAREVRRR